MNDVTLAAAFGAGVVSFLSPCVLPIVPGYLSMVTGLEIAELEAGERRHLGRIARDTALFVVGFGSVFVLLGVTATSLGRALLRNQGVLTRVSGVIVLVMALFIIGGMVLRAPWLYGERRFHPDLSRFGPFAAPVAGAAFGFGWTPCIGPVLTSILAIAGQDGDPGRGGLLLGVYSLGLGVPFLAVGLGFGKLSGALGRVRRHLRAVTLGSALVLAAFGVVLTLNQLSWLTDQVRSGFEGVGLGSLVELG